MALLEIKDLYVDFRTVDGLAKVIDDVSFDVKEGESLALVGESGCGKTTIIKAILKILPDYAIVRGNIKFKGINLLELDEDKFYRIKGREFSYIPQEPLTALSPLYTIADHFIDLFVFSGKRKVSWFEYGSLRKKMSSEVLEKAAEYLRIVKIPDPDRVLNSYTIQLSGGMLQRCLIAMAIAKNPSLILADEPTTALDVITQKEILNLMKDLRKRVKTTIIYITHNLGVAREIAERIIVMYAGKIVEIASSEDVLLNPLHPYTKGLIESIPKLTGGELKGIEGGVINYYNPPKGCRFHPRCPLARDICRREAPKLIRVNRGHLVACHIIGERI